MPESASQLPAPTTRDALLDAARCLFAERGYASVSVRQIAEAAGANIAAVNYHFGSKRDLYLETVRLAMSGEEGENPFLALEGPPLDRDAARVQLVRFVRQFFDNMLGDQDDRACGLLMMWEAVQPSEAIDAVVDSFVRPRQELLVGLVRSLLTEDERGRAIWCARSILGQILHYHVFRHFIERLEDADAGRKNPVVNPEEAVTHIVRFSLRAMGHDDRDINLALERAAAQSRAASPSSPHVQESTPHGA